MGWRWVGVGGLGLGWFAVGCGWFGGGLRGGGVLQEGGGGGIGNLCFFGRRNRACFGLVVDGLGSRRPGHRTC